MNYLGIDLGGTNIKVGLVNHLGKILIHDQMATQGELGLEKMVENMISLSGRILEQGKEQGIQVEAAGIGVPGPVDGHGVVTKCVNLNWPVVPIGEILTEALGFPVFAGNDGTLASLGEYKVGALKGVHTGVALTLGTGIGGGVIVYGTCLAGANGIGGEIGHMIVGENFYNCNCGRNGCLETFSSATALVNYTKKIIGDGRESTVQGLTGGNLEALDGLMVMNQAKLGDAVCLEAVNRGAKYLGIGIVNLVSVIDPERIVIGGGISKAGEWFFEKIRKSAMEARYFKDFPIPEIICAHFGNEIGIVGAAMLAKGGDR
ncbi:MAG: ROK family protein [Anaerovorax sp.]